MNEITKFSRNMLEGKPLHMRKKLVVTSFDEYHWHDYYEIILYLDCIGQCIINDRPYKIEGCCLFLVTPKDFHKIQTEDNEKSQTINISFSEQVIDPQLLPRILTCPIMLYNADSEIISNVKKLYEVYRSDGEYKKKYVEHLFNCILIDIYEKGKKISGNSIFLNPMIQRAITEVTTAPDKKHTVRSMAGSLGVNADYFSHLFKRETGISFTRYLNNYRIDHAKRLLVNSGLTTLEICYEAGFNSPAHFYKTFKLLAGTSPDNYRKSTKK